MGAINDMISRNKANLDKLRGSGKTFDRKSEYKIKDQKRNPNFPNLKFSHEQFKAFKERLKFSKAREVRIYLIVLFCIICMVFIGVHNFILNERKTRENTELIRHFNQVKNKSYYFNYYTSMASGPYYNQQYDFAIPFLLAAYQIDPDNYENHYHLIKALIQYQPHDRELMQTLREDIYHLYKPHPNKNELLQVKIEIENVLDG